MRLLASALVVFFLAADVAMEERTEEITGEPFAMDRGPLDQLGWGTLEDLYVDLGGGAAVNVFSGNLVVSVRPFVRADVVADSQLALTYNHLDSDGHPELGPGWSYDLGRYTAPGAWGDRVIVDADGATDDFFAGEPPDNEEVRQIVDELVRAWKRDTPRKERRAVGGDDAMRSMLGSDPLFLGEMRLRYLGPAAAPEVSAGEELIWRSSRRGERALLQGDGELILTRSDGGLETYSIEGQLTQVDPPGGPTIKLKREAGRLTTVTHGRTDRFRVSADSWGRFRTIDSSDGPDAEFEYSGRSLWRLQAPAGSWRFEYDGRGRLTSIDGPDGRVTVRYDDATGRVAEAIGPGGTLDLAAPDGTDVAKVLATIDSAPMTVIWDPRGRVRTLSGGGVSQEVRFAGRRPLPVAVTDGASTVRFRWDAGGRLVEAATDGIAAEWKRDTDGVLIGLVDGAGEEARIEASSDGGVLGWTDPAGRSTALVVDAAGRPSRIDRPGGLSETIWRTDVGLIKSIATTGGESLEVRRDGSGFVRSVESVVSGTAGFDVDARGRVVGFDAPSGGSLEVRRGTDGRVGRAADGGSGFDLRYGATAVEGWTGPRGGVRVHRDGAGLPIRLEVGGGLGWELDRALDGLPSELRREGHADVELEYEDGLAIGWSRGDGRTTSFERDRDSGRVVGWVTSGQGRIALERDDAGRTIGLLRGSGRWKLERDRSGRVRRIADPGGGRAEIQVDGGGRPSVVSTGEGHRFTLRHARDGQLVELRGLIGAGWKLRFGRGGLPAAVTDPEGRTAELRWDRASRWSELSLPGVAKVEAGWGPLGPSRAAGSRFVIAPSGALTGWGPAGEVGSWDVQRDAQGRAKRVAYREGAGAGRRRSVEEAPEIERSRGGRVLRVGAWEPRWRNGRLDGVAAPVGATTATWSLRTDGPGRVRGLDGPGGGAAEVTFDSFGYVREVAITPEGGAAQTWGVERNPAGRVDAIEGPSDLRWTLERDSSGRVRGWTAGDRRAAFEPIDGTIFRSDDAIADALGVTTDDDGPVVIRESGSRSLVLGIVDGPDVISLEELRGLSGALASVDGFWGSTSTPVLDESPIQPAMLPSAEAADPLDDPIAAALSAPALALAWAGSTVGSSDGAAFLPAPDGRGAGASASGWLRVAANDGGTLTWLGPGGAINGLRLPGPYGGWSTPEGWLGYPAPPRVLDPPVVGSPSVPVGPGDVHAVELWWSARDVGAADLARLPTSLLGPDPRAWIAPRGAIFAASSRVPVTAPAHAGIGAAVPPVPGARRLLPGIPGVDAITPLTALELSGDLPLGADAHRAFVDLPDPAWTVDVPGASVLRDVARRRAHSSTPPGWRAGAVAGLSPGLDGFLSADGANATEQAPAAPRPAVEGLPKGTGDVIPGLCANLPGAFGSLPIDARCSALEGLSDHPIVPGAPARDAVEDDALLLALPTLEARGPAPLSGWAAPATAAERWVLETAAGSRFVVDRGGRLLSADLGGRLRQAAGRRAFGFAARSLLDAAGPTPRVPDPAVLGAPPYLPQAGDVPETRWGLAPGDPRFPMTSRGEPELTLFRAGVGLPAASDPHVFPALR